MKVFDNIVADSLVYALQTVNFLCQWMLLRLTWKFQEVNKLNLKNKRWLIICSSSTWKYFEVLSLWVCGWLGLCLKHMSKANLCVPLYYFFFFKHKPTYKVPSPEHCMYKTQQHQRQCSASLQPDNILATAELDKEIAIVLFFFFFF